MQSFSRYLGVLACRPVFPVDQIFSDLGAGAVATGAAGCVDNFLGEDAFDFVYLIVREPIIGYGVVLAFVNLSVPGVVSTRRWL